MSTRGIPFFSDPLISFQFIDWARCIDAAKAKDENYVEKCSDSFGFLLNCQNEHGDYFREIFGSSDDEEGDDTDEGSQSDAVEAEGKEKGKVDIKERTTQSNESETSSESSS
jgi:hypothetical protein